MARKSSKKQTKSAGQAEKEKKQLEPKLNVKTPSFASRVDGLHPLMHLMAIDKEDEKNVIANNCSDEMRSYLKNMTALALVNDEGRFTVASPADAAKDIDWNHENDVDGRLRAMNDDGAQKPGEIAVGNPCGLKYTTITRDQMVSCSTRGALVKLVKGHYQP